MNSEIHRLSQLLRCDFYTGKIYWRSREGNVALNSPKQNGYLGGRVRGKYYYAHRVVWALAHGRWPLITDHINRDRQDNRLKNLREVSYSENAQNRNHYRPYKGIPAAWAS